MHKPAPIVLTAVLMAAIVAPARPVMAQTAHPLPAGNIHLHLNKWPHIGSGAPDATRKPIETRVNALLKRMTLQEKVGQILQPEIVNITPEQVHEYHIGSVLNGGNARPGNNPHAKVSAWLALADKYYQASVDTSDGGVGIPVIWGIDSVHGDNSVYGGTIFPHNIGLGAANDPQLMQEIGRVTAEETSAIGVDWAFAPTIAVARDDRWGRTYESYSENPHIVSRLGANLVKGLQGDNAGAGTFFEPGSVIATAKHFIADGGTENGHDQGNAIVSEKTLRTLFFPPYVAALKAGAQTVMASYSEWNGVRMHGNGPLLTLMLKQHAGFDGFVIGDYNGHAMIPGCTAGNCPQALLAGIDMYMVPAAWKTLYHNLIAQVKDGTIPMARLDDAVRRILRVKMRAHMFTKGKPSARPYAGQSHIGTPAHRALARRAACESLVLLKDNPKLLPFSASSHVLVAGQGADSVPMLVGGWSLNWQGTGLSNQDFPTGTSVYAGLAAALEAGGGSARLSQDGSFTTRPDVAVVVFGEKPYAEYQGDRESVLYKLPDADPDLKLMRKLKAEGVPVVGVFLSGRPLWINPQINAADAMIAAFLPGTEGGHAIADLLVAGKDGRPRHDFRGKLSFSWPRSATQTPLNAGDAHYHPLFPLGYGLKLETRKPVARLSEDPGLSPALIAAASHSAFFNDGRALTPWRIYLGDAENKRRKTRGKRIVTSPTGAVRFESADRNRQEDTRLATWTGSGKASMFILGSARVDMRSHAKAGDAVVIEAAVRKRPGGKVEAGLGTVNRHAMIDVTDLFRKARPGVWQNFSIPLRCFAAAGIKFDAVDMPLLLRTDAAFALQISSMRLAAPEGRIAHCGSAAMKSTKP